MTGTFRLALAAVLGGHGIEQTPAVERNGVIGRSIGLNQAAVELQVGFALLPRVWCADGTCVGPRDAGNKF